MLLVFGTGAAVGLHLGLLHLFLWRSPGALFTFVGSSLFFSSATYVLWRWVFPHLGGRGLTAQVAVQWAARQPAIGAVILGARTLEQFEDNLAALDKPLSDAAMQALDAASALPQQFPYSFFDPSHQAGMNGGVGVGDKPAGYERPVWTDAAPLPGYAPATRPASA